MIRRSMRVLSRSDQRKVIAVTCLQICMSFLDLLGVVAIGLLGALSVTGLQSQNPGDKVSSALRFMQISHSTFQTQVIIIGTGAVFLLVGRTILSIFFTRRTLFFLARRGAKISSDLIARLLSQPFLTVQAKTTQESLYAVTKGVELIVLAVLAPTIILISDFALLLVMAIGLFAVDPITAIGTFSIFLLIGYLLYRFMHVRVTTLGIQNSKFSIVSNEKIVEVFSSYRESIVRNRRDYYAREIGKLRFALANVSAESAFMPYVSKYVIETAIILGALLISGAQFILQDTTQAVATLAIFLAAGTRIAPAILRVQQGSILIQGSLGQAAPTLDLIDQLGDFLLVENVNDSVDIIHSGFQPEIIITNISFTYPNNSKIATSEVTLTIPAGTSVAFVGPSGAGKTTLVDILLGVLNPDHGTVLISGLPPLLAVAKWPGAISYVPQDVVIAAGTIRENVALGYPLEAATNELVMDALRVANLDRFVTELPLGVDTPIGERGTKISGGQRQRLGIARAMFTHPHLLVLDEATSALDSETEDSISKSIRALQGWTTVVIIAHRLSTVRDADIVVYLSEGRMVAHGSFEEVRVAVPDFNRQTKLMGL